MEEKKADNKITQTKIQLRNVEDRLVQTKDILKSIENLEENFLHLNKNVNQCIELLNSSIKNKKVTNTIDSINKDIQQSYKKSNSNILDEKEITMKKINDLNNKIEELNNQIKEEINKQDKEQIENNE